MEVKTLVSRIVSEVSKAVVDKEDVIRLVLYTILANGHVLIEDYPGLAKTMLAKSLARVMGLKFSRIQFTPDLMPSDITGSNILDQRTLNFVFREGPVFANVVLADEINRAPPKTQSALLEAMQERQVTVDGKTHRLPEPFTVIATQNPIEYEGTYPLPEAQVDRFLVKIGIGYPSLGGEIEILKRRVARKADEVELERVASAEDVLSAQRRIEDVYVDESIMRYIVAIVRATREHPNVEVGASPRGSLALLKLSRVRAAANGRDYVIPDDVKAVVIPALHHRLILRSELWIKGVKPSEIIRQILEKIPVPKVVE